MSADDFAEKVADKLKDKKPTPESTRRKNLNPTISTPQDLQSNILFPQTGRAKIGEGLSNVYTVKYVDTITNEISEVSYWDLISSVTPDTRMSNLDPNKPEYAFVQWGMDIWLKCLHAGLPRSASLAQGMVLATTEPSLAKNMTFLKNIQTVRQESQHVQIEEPPKATRNLFGFLKK